MRISPRTLCSAGLLATLAALGCQPAPATAPVADPRPVRVHDAMALEPDTDAAITLDRGCADGYGLKQVPAALDPRIDHFLLRLTGPSHPAPGGRVVRIDVASFTGCIKVAHFDDLYPGRYRVVLDARDARGNYLWGNSGEVDVAAGQAPAPLTLNCRYRVLPISATPWPSPSPQPSPTATPPPPPPSPTPNPCQVPGSASYPAAVVPNPAAHFERIHGLHADALGRVYLFGMRPMPWPADRIDIGRMARIDQQGGVTPLNPHQNSNPPGDRYRVAFEVDLDHTVSDRCRPGQFFGFVGARPRRPNSFPNVTLTSSANQAMLRIENGGQTVHYLETQGGAGDFVRPWGASTAGSVTGGATGLHIGPGQRDDGKLPGYNIRYTYNTMDMRVDRMNLTGPRTAAVERPLSLIWDRVRTLPIWTSKLGVLTVAKSNKPKDPPKVLVNRPVYGISRIADFPFGPNPNKSNQVLLTTYTAGEQDVYFVDLDAHQGQPATQANLRVAFHFNAGIPHRVERGPDGLFYVLLQQGPLPVDGTAGLTSSGGGDGGDPYFHEFPGSNRIRVVQLRWDAANKRLYDPRLVADSFTDPTPSF